VSSRITRLDAYCYGRTRQKSTAAAETEALATPLERGGGQMVGEFARQVAEAELDLLRIQKLKAARFNTPSRSKARGLF
jgi:hypothetical protein